MPYIVLILVLKAIQLDGARQHPTQQPDSPALEATWYDRRLRHKKPQMPKKCYIKVFLVITWEILLIFMCKFTDGNNT